MKILVLCESKMRFKKNANQERSLYNTHTKPTIVEQQLISNEMLRKTVGPYKWSLELMLENDGHRFEC